MGNCTERDFGTLDCIRDAVDEVKNLAFDEKSPPRVTITDNEWFRRIAQLRAFSGARAKLVEEMINRQAMERAFCRFDAAEAQRLTAQGVLAQHWHELGAMRFKRKVPEILKAAKAISSIGQEFGSFQAYLEHWSFPARITVLRQIDQFWAAFDALRNDLKTRDIPIIQNEVTLLHFLENEMHLDCLKPDLIVMRVATNTGLVPPKGKGRERLLVSKVQEYCTHRDLRPGRVDRYLLAFGGQSYAKKFVKRSYCTKGDGCASPDCPVGEAGHCATWAARREQPA